MIKVNSDKDKSKNDYEITLKKALKILREACNALSDAARTRKSEIEAMDGGARAMVNAENWRKENCSDLSEVKKLIKGETPYETCEFIPILHNDHCVYLQFGGWSINLYNDGTWCWEDTTGG